MCATSAGGKIVHFNANFSWCFEKVTCAWPPLSGISYNWQFMWVSFLHWTLFPDSPISLKCSITICKSCWHLKYLDVWHGCERELCPNLNLVVMSGSASRITSNIVISVACYISTEETGLSALPSGTCNLFVEATFVMNVEISYDQSSSSF